MVALVDYIADNLTVERVTVKTLGEDVDLMDLKTMIQNNQLLIREFQVIVLAVGHNDTKVSPDIFRERYLDLINAITAVNLNARILFKWFNFTSTWVQWPS